MSLNFNYAKCRNSDELHSHPSNPDLIHPVTEAVIWNMMAIDMTDITDKNVDEVWFRTALHSLTTDACAVVFNDPEVGYQRVYLTRADIERHIGLYTNVAQISRAKWLARRYGTQTSISMLNTRDASKTAMQLVAEQAERMTARAAAE
jgi:hypothetical protein